MCVTAAGIDGENAAIGGLRGSLRRSVLLYVRTQATERNEADALYNCVFK